MVPKIAVPPGVGVGTGWGLGNGGYKTRRPNSRGGVSCGFQGNARWGQETRPGGGLLVVRGVRAAVGVVRRDVGGGDMVEPEPGLGEGTQKIMGNDNFGQVRSIENFGCDTFGRPGPIPGQLFGGQQLSSKKCGSPGCGGWTRLWIGM